MSSRKTNLTQRIKQEASRLGFDLIGITTPAPPPHLDIYRHWLGMGRHGEMGYLARQSAILRRSNPLEILPECKSIIVTSMNYAPSKTNGIPSFPRIATYALGEDYHDIIIARLEELVRFIHASVGRSIPYRIYTDTGPLLERELAQRSGIGWIGKNTCLIHPRMGSYFFLGEILLGLELEIDPPFVKDHCGTCTRCIESCPTGCILPDRTIDARRCISYLTIELKDAIPQELRSLLGEWIFGCDICQQVCPWTMRFAQTTNERAFQPNSFLMGQSFPTLLRLTQDDFRTHFRKSPFKRTKWVGMLRNMAVAAGNLGTTEVVPILADLLMHHENSMVRSHTAWALGKIGNQEAQNALNSAKEKENDPVVLEEITDAIQASVKPG